MPTRTSELPASTSKKWPAVCLAKGPLPMATDLGDFSQLDPDVLLPSELQKVYVDVLTKQASLHE